MSNPISLFDLNPFADGGWVRGQRLQDYVNTQLANKSIEQSTRPLIVVAANRSDKYPVFFTSGNLGVAIRASSAVPGIIFPVGILGTEYEDGDMALPVATCLDREIKSYALISSSTAFANTSGTS